MTCYAPMVLYKSRMGRNPVTGKWPLTGIKDGYKDLPVELPCGRCIGCRLEKSRQWAIRCMHEAAEHEPSEYEKFKTPYGEKNGPVLNCLSLLLIAIALSFMGISQRCTRNISRTSGNIYGKPMALESVFRMR